VKLRDKVAIVTGSASGIGRATMIRLALEGAKVVGADIEGDAGSKVAEQIRAEGGQAEFVRTDVTKAEEVRRMVATAVERYGTIDILSSNVGVVVGNPVADVSEEEWEQIMAVNLKSMFLCAKNVIPHMQRQKGGSIIFMSSGNGLVAEPALATYCATKAAIIGLTRSIATDYGKDNIRCNCICPTYTRTPLVEKWISSGVDPSLTWGKVNSLHVLNRIAEPEEIAQAVLFLASEGSSVITGIALPVDGGLTCFR
jgi:dihydroanticapsin dehydrogenase